MSPRPNLLVVGLMAIALLGLFVGFASGDSVGENHSDGSKVRINEREATNLPTAPAAAGGAGAVAASSGPQPRYEYRFASACERAAGTMGDSNCAWALLACPVGGGPGPLTDIFRRTVVGTTPVTGWSQVGSTCYPPATARPAVTMAMILEAFHLTRWATPAIATQPEGNVTLVGLKTFYRIGWSAEGFEPGEVDVIDPARMLGHQVQIRPRVQSFTYVFGDGQSSPPTTSTGGTYPNGDVVHSYATAGRYAARVDVTWAADFRVDGGAWAPIPDQVVVPGPATEVTVKTAKAVLVN
jgi:hypothetical protein